MDLQDVLSGLEKRIKPKKTFEELATPVKGNVFSAPYKDLVRHDGSGLKGQGYYGALPMQDGSGRTATEYSIGVNMNEKDMDIPTMVPGLSRDQLEYILTYGKTTPEINNIAAEHAQKRLKAGLSPYFD